VVNSYLYLIVFIVRKLLPKFLRREGKSDLRKINKYINSFLYFLGVLERKYDNLFPFGASIVDVLKVKK
jgi:hypothetical protein